MERIRNRWHVNQFKSRFHETTSYEIFLRITWFFFCTQPDRNPKPNFTVFFFFFIRSSGRVTRHKNSRVFLIDIPLVQIVALILKLHIINKKAGFYLRYRCLGCCLFLLYCVTKFVKSFSPDLQGSGLNQI